MQELKSKLKEVFWVNANFRTNTESIKIHVSDIDINQLNSLADLSRKPEVRDLNIKRSGTGLTIIITL